ncbi:MAG: AAA family ATPase [Candidatus Paceibacterota bacterium]
MILESIKYAEFKGTNKEWSLTHPNLGKVNLIVGKNASGKTRTVNIISSLSNLLSGKVKPNLQSSDYNVVFKDKGVDIQYKFIIAESKVVSEELIKNRKILLKRNKGGKGKIVTYPSNKSVNFQTPDSELTSNVRRDSVQHPFFEDLYSWSSKLHLYRFGKEMGQDKLMLSKQDVVNEPKLKEAEGVFATFKEGKEKYGMKFVNSVIKDMGSIGYNLEYIKIDKPTNIVANMELLCLVIKERDIIKPISQLEISTGMFRALSLIIQINYYAFASKQNCILIDDIGEGLDFDRATKLIEIIIKKAENSDTQLIMSTNDRFVMNNVPLKYWSIIQRNNKGSKIFNYQNSKKIFDEFEFTGLNNFDFFSKDFFEKGFKK